MFWSFLRLIGRLRTPESGPDRSSETKNLKYAKYLKTNAVNRDYRSEMHLKIIRHIKELKCFTRKYWYVVLPLHGILTVAYVGLFYLGSRKTQGALEWMNIGQEGVEPAHWKYFPNIPKRTLEDIAITLVLLKISAPLRYASTFVGSKYLVEFLRGRQLIKCLPMGQVANNNVSCNNKEGSAHRT